MTAGAQAKPTGAASGANVTDADQLQALLVDIFAQTGQKVEINDPLVAAALIHSALLRRAGQDAARAIKDAAQHTERSTSEEEGEFKRVWHFLSLWHTQVMLGTFLFFICFLASVFGTLLVSNRCS